VPIGAATLRGEAYAPVDERQPWHPFDVGMHTGEFTGVAFAWHSDPTRPTATVVCRRSLMAKYLISFPSAALVVPDSDWETVVRDSHAVIEEAKAAGVYVFGGGIDEGVPPVLVSADGTVAMGGYPWAPTLDGGFTVLELPSRDEAIAWAARIARACRCDQELRVFGFDPQS
jgi:hypothetical protein